jgi:hypothetical protein
VPAFKNRPPLLTSTLMFVIVPSLRNRPLTRKSASRPVSTTEPRTTTVPLPFTTTLVRSQQPLAVSASPFTVKVTPLSTVRVEAAPEGVPTDTCRPIVRLTSTCTSAPAGITISSAGPGSASVLQFVALDHLPSLAPPSQVTVAALAPATPAHVSTTVISASEKDRHGLRRRDR